MLFFEKGKNGIKVRSWQTWLTHTHTHTHTHTQRTLLPSTKNYGNKTDHQQHQLPKRLQRLYPNFTFDTVPIVLGSTGYISKSLRTNLEKCGFDTNKSLKMIPILQRKALRGSVKIVKTALKLKWTVAKCGLVCWTCLCFDFQTGTAYFMSLLRI